MEFLTESDVLRFWSKVSIGSEEDCWLWKAKAANPSGYGVLKVREHGNIVASRVSCFLRYGRPPEGKPFAIHSCDTPACCNPGHLRWGSQIDNMADAIERGRKTAPPKAKAGRKTSAVGDRKPNTVLTDDIVRQIWSLHLSGLSGTEIAAALKVSLNPVVDVCRGRSWRHLPDAPSLEQLRAGGVRRGHNQFARGQSSRDAGTRTKIPSSEIPVILMRLGAGETLAAVGASYGVRKSAICKIRQRYS